MVWMSSSMPSPQCVLGCGTALFLTMTWPSGPTESGTPALPPSNGSAQARLVASRFRYSANSEIEPRPSGRPRPPATLSVAPSSSYVPV